MKRGLLVLIAALGASGAFAADGTWTNGTPVDAVFTNTANWIGGIAPSGNSSAIFKGTSVAPGSAIDLTGMSGVKQLRFDVADEVWTIGTGAADSQTWVGESGRWNGITMYNNVTADQIVNAKMDWASGANGATINNQSDNGSSLTINGQVDAGGKTVIFQGDGDASIFMNSTLNSANSGVRRVEGATVMANSLSTGSLDFRHGGELTLNNDQNVGAIRFGQTSAGDYTDGGDDVFTIGAGNQVYTTGGSLNYFSATNGAANTGTIQGGDFSFNANWRNIIVEDNTAVEGAELTISSDITGGVTGGYDLNKDGAGTLLLSGDNSVDGIDIFAIKDGRVQFTQAGSLGDAHVRLGSGTTSATIEFVGSNDVTLVAGMRSQVTGDSGTAVTILANGVDDAALTLAPFNGNGTGDKLVLGGESKGLNVVNDDLNDLETLDGGLIKSGGGTWALRAAQTYIGDTDVNEGNLILMDDDTLSSSPTAYTVASGATLSYKFGPTDGGDWSDTQAITSFESIGAGFADGSFVGAYVDAADSDLINDTDPFQEPVGNSVGFRKTGAGELVVNKTMGLSGALLVDEGTMTFGNGYGGGSMGAGAIDVNMTADATIANGATLKFRKNQSMEISGDLSGSGDIEMDAYQKSSESPRGNIDTLTITGDGSGFTGTTTLSDGKLAIGDGGTTGSLGGDIVTTHADQSVTFNRNNVYTNIASISGSGSVVQTGGNDLYVTTANTYTGGTLIEDGDLFLTHEDGLGTGTITLADRGINPVLKLTKKNVTYANDIVFANVGGNKTLSFWENGVATVSGDITLDEGNAAQSRISVGQSAGNQAKLTLSGNLSGASGFSVIGNEQGVVELTGDNDYSGVTIVTIGTLIINGDNSSATGAVTVQADGTLAGSGTVGGATTVAGALNPGNSPGTLTFEQSLTIAGTLTLELAGTGAGEFDILANDDGDTITFEDGATIAFDTTGYSAVNGDSFEVLNNWDDYAGTLGNLNITGTDLGGGLSLDTSNLLVDGTVSVIPEPAVASLVVLFGLGILIAKRRFT